MFSGRLSERSRQSLTGAIALTLTMALVVFGVRATNGALKPRYQLRATFSSAGQGLLPGSDVKIHGVNIGKVKNVRLRDGRALVRMDIDKGERVPVSSSATIRPKTLFGEKFVDIDPGDAESSGPFLADEQPIADTTGGFELEKVLTELYPILQAVDPDELMTIIGELSVAGEGMGPTVNRTIENFSKVAGVQARHAEDTQQFLDDFALLSEELATRADDLLGLADDLNAALPELSSRGDQLATVLDSAAQLSGDVADVLAANQGFLDKSVTKGSRTLQTLFDRRSQIPPLVTGLRQFLQVLAEVGRIELGDGTRLAAVKGILGGGSPCGRTTSECPAYNGPPAGQPSSAGSGPRGAGVSARPTPGLDAPVPLAPPISGSDGVRSLLEGLLR